MAGRARETTRGPLTIDVHGDTAVILGEQSNRTETAGNTVATVSYVATQVARRANGRWQLVLMQLTQKAPKGAG
jgi:ketosteroid isomerase-like protein